MNDTNRPYHLRFGVLGSTVFLVLLLLAMKELLLIFGPGLVVHPAIGVVVGTATSFFLLLSFAFRRRTHVDYSCFSLTAADEESRAEVAGALRSLSPSSFGFNQLVFRDFTIDHLILCPQGCLVVHTRGMLGELYGDAEHLRIDGRPADCLISECWHQAHYIQEMLQREFHQSVDVIPVLCLPRVPVKDAFATKGVIVTDLDGLPEVIGGYQEEAIPSSFFLILSGFLAKKAHGEAHEPYGSGEHPAAVR